MPRVSVFLFCRNRVATIRRSVESVLSQTFTDIEYVIQDGASTDGTLEILREYNDPRIVLRSEPDSGPAEAFWTGLRRCRGEFVCACLSDEELLPHAVADAVAALDRMPKAVALTRDAELTFTDGRRTGDALGQPFELVDYMANRFAPNFAAAMFRRDALDAVGLQTRDWALDCGEFELWCRLALLGPIAYLPGIVARYGIHAAQLSADPANVLRLGHGRLRAIARIAAETTLFDGNPGLLRACRAATVASFSRQLVKVGASELAVELAMTMVDEPGLLPTAGPTPALGEYVRVAQAQRAAGRERVAAAVLDAATRHTTLDVPLMHEVARTQAAAGFVDQALAMYELIIRDAPDLLDAYWERGELLERRGLVDDALESWRRSDVTRDAARHSLYLVASLKSPTSTSRSLYAAHREWDRHHARRPFYLTDHTFSDWTPGDRITVGYSCSFWDADTITYQLLPMLRRHDRSRFRVIAYVAVEPGPLVTAAVDEVVVAGRLSDDEYVRRVRADGVHILVEINGHSPGHRFAAMAARCAPIQVSYLNYTSTCGVDEVDYILGDAISVPQGTEIYFTESVYRMPGCFFCFTYEDAALPPVAPPPSLTSGVVTFGCFGSGGKINPPLLDLWAEILRRTPGSRLFIRNNELTPADNRLALQRAFEARGISRDRLLILAGTNRQGVLESYGQVDISLDTFPYCGGNTIAESLWQGVPVVTLKGHRMSEAYGASLLTASGLPELVAEAPEDYIRIAVTLAGDAGRLAAYRTTLRSMVMSHGFSDANRFTGNLEAAYLDMMARRFAKAPERDWREPLALLADASARDVGSEWARRFGRPEFADLNRTLFELGSRGLGLDNGGEADTSGERWLLNRLGTLLSDVAAPTIVDVGAHEGALARDILRAVPTARLHAFEPVAATFDVLEASLAGTGAVVSNMALGASTGTLTLHNHGVDGGSMHGSSYPELFRRFYGTSTGSVEVPLTTLDRYCAEHAIQHIDLLKIDTEGHELDVLRGAAHLLCTGGVRLLLFEFNYTHIFSRTFLSDFFETLPDFAFFRLLPTGLLPLSRRDWSGTEVFRHQNVLALPEANRHDLTQLIQGSHG